MTEPQRFGFEGIVLHGFARLKAGKHEIFHLRAVGEGKKITSHIAGSMALSICKTTKNQSLKNKYDSSKDHLIHSGHIMKIHI